MRKYFLAGSIASGKSTVARELERLGARRIDLDEVSREVCSAGSSTVLRLAEAFGADVMDAQTLELRRDVLAQRAFASEESTRMLESITHPAIFEELERQLAKCADGADGADGVCVVEVPLLDRALEYKSLVDGIVCVVCPTDVRRKRAQGRGMDPEDFDRRNAQQPSQEYLMRHADVTFVNDKDEEALVAQVSAWWNKARDAACRGE
ncbi:MAG: dephospho-CoA kinase [Atopobiaceae bacterium]|nr:dephospho-CoA kinase [Atopobiaceae bacterium]